MEMACPGLMVRLRVLNGTRRSLMSVILTGAVNIMSVLALYE